MSQYTVLFDANVLYPAPMRDALMQLAVTDLFKAKWTADIHREWIDWAVVFIFCGYIGYDWGRANRIPKTVDNAIDSAAALYMDIINLFLRILRILGRRR